MNQLNSDCFSKKFKNVTNIDFGVLPIFTPLFTVRPLPRYILCHGGRGSGKSTQVAGVHILLGLQEPGVRIVCGRETQRSIKESVYQLLRDIICKLGISHMYTFTNQNILCKNGTKYAFEGMRAGTQLTDSFKSIENIKYLWLEEAQSLSDLTLNLVRPTIRAKGSSIFFTANQKTVADPVFKMFNTLPEEAKMVIYSTYKDNPALSSVLREEAEREKIVDFNKYKHVWLGYPQSQISNAILNVDDVLGSLERDSSEVLSLGEEVVGVDVARTGEDKTVFIKRVSANVIDYKVYDTVKQKNLANIEGELLNFTNDHTLIIIDETGIGGGLVDRMRANNRNVIGVNFGSKPHNHRFVNRVCEMWFNFKDVLPKISLKALKKEFGNELLQELTTRAYGYDAMNKYKIQPKDEHKKEIGRSCDLADALILCFSTFDKGNQKYASTTAHNVWRENEFF